MPDNPNVTSLNFDIIGPFQLCEIVKTFESKTSCDLDGIITKLLKRIISESAYLQPKHLYRHFPIHAENH